MVTERPVLPGWYWFKGFHVTGAARFTEWMVLQVKDENQVLSPGSDIIYRLKDLNGEWQGPILRPEE